jgi:hypothetical protein
MNLVFIKLHARNTEAVKVQEILTKHGCHINVRLGLHEFNEAACSNEGLIVLQVKPDTKATAALLKDLKTLKKTDVKALSL